MLSQELVFQMEEANMSISLIDRTLRKFNSLTFIESLLSPKAKGKGDRETYIQLNTLNIHLWYCSVKTFFSTWGSRLHFVAPGFGGDNLNPLSYASFRLSHAAG